MSRKNPLGPRKRKTNERGQAIILIVFAIIGLIGITALTVDGGNAYLERRRVQNAVDSTALGGAIARIKGSGWVNESYRIAEINGYDNNGETNTVQVFSPPESGVYAGDLEYIQVRITSRISTFFGGVIGIREITVSGEAIARTKLSEITEILSGNAIISLAPTSDCQDERAFWVRGESSLIVSGGGIFVNSNNRECALQTNGNGSIRIDGGVINVVGAAKIAKPQLITPYPPITNTPPISYPPPFFMPDIGCGGKFAEIQEDGETMSPGIYDEDFPPEGVTSLQPGVYCLGGDFIVNGPISGSGVVFVLDGKLRLGGDATINLSAPKSGDFAGLLIYAPIENKNRMIISSDRDSSLHGTILMPGAEININGGNTQIGYHSQIIGYRIISNGQSAIAIKYRDDQNYDTYTMPEVQLIK
jgi:hypothetical protein